MRFRDRHRALAFCLSMIFPDLPSPAEACFAEAGNRLPLFGIMLGPNSQNERIVMHRVWLACFPALFVLSGSAAHAQISDDVVKIGVLTDLSGPAATATGPGSVTAAQMAVEDFGGKVLGKPIVVISADHQIKPDIGAGIARHSYD